MVGQAGTIAFDPTVQSFEIIDNENRLSILEAMKILAVEIDVQYRAERGNRGSCRYVSVDCYFYDSLYLLFEFELRIHSEWG